MAGGNVALRCENLSKRYTLGESSGIGTLAEWLGRGWKSLLGSASQAPAERRHIWSLKDVSFEVAAGSVLGVIGRNGAGKSTLLKLLSRITYPTEGRILYNGTIASLLEVGMGFKHELTGRDNIFLSGSILGLRSWQIQKHFDEIVEFAEIGEFLDTPVKRYSSGMFVRLAFSVAAHLEPDILLIDEVLAVGDQKFQRKCLNQLHEAARQGRTVIFVSHNMQAVTQLCREALLLEAGRLVQRGPVQEVVEGYQQRNLSGQERLAVCERAPAPGARAAITRAGLCAVGTRAPQLFFDILEPIGFEVAFEVREAMSDLKAILYLNTLDGVCQLSSFSLDWRNYTQGAKESAAPRAPGRYVARGRIPAPLFNSGTYEIVFALGGSHELHLDITPGLTFEITDHHGSFASCITRSRSHGTVAAPVEWSEEKLG